MGQSDINNKIDKAIEIVQSLDDNVFSQLRKMDFIEFLQSIRNGRQLPEIFINN